MKVRADTIILLMHFSFWQMNIEWHRHQNPSLPTCFVEITDLVADDWHHCRQGCHLSRTNFVILSIRRSCRVHHLDRPPHQVDLHNHPMPTYVARHEEEIPSSHFLPYVDLSPSTYPHNSSGICIVARASSVGNAMCSIWMVYCETCKH
ncbi:Uncharacterized protein TCM_033153 [Theobroma cacao]|uniref:Uncharacterized protein n=1 Tax=Theobroma cacao TaxID=3641 RepID=A0A061FHT1_THECC|nr:Uncharacterized protein TCM_033153 [Theobroma cacao]